jgi:hypothetical protein
LALELEMERRNSRPLILAVLSLKTSQTWKKGKGAEGATGKKPRSVCFMFAEGARADVFEWK